MILFQSMMAGAGAVSPALQPPSWALNKPKLMLCQLRAAKTTLYFILIKEEVVIICTYYLHFYSFWLWFHCASCWCLVCTCEFWYTQKGWQERRCLRWEWLDFLSSLFCRGPALLCSFGWMFMSLLCAFNSSRGSASGDLSMCAASVRTELWRSQLGSIPNKFSTEIKQLAEQSCFCLQGCFLISFSRSRNNLITGEFLQEALERLGRLEFSGWFSCLPCLHEAGWVRISVFSLF